MKGTVLVTGGARRLGKAIADALRARGWNVIAASRTSPDAAFAVDLAEPDGPARLFAAARAVAPDLCAVVNNAAVFSHDAELPPNLSLRAFFIHSVSSSSELPDSSREKVGA